jgi:hypothetical protein
MKIYQKNKKKINDRFVNIICHYSDLLEEYEKYIKLAKNINPMRTSTQISANCAISSKYITYIEKFGVPCDGVFNEKLLSECQN